MSYTPGFAPDARSQWEEMEIRFQEIVLDKLDELCDSPPRKIEFVSEAVVEEGKARHILFVHVTVDDSRETITLVGTAHVIRSIET